MPTVVSHCANHTDYKSTTANSLRTTTRSKVSMFPKDTGVFFMYTDDMLNNDRTTIICNISSRLECI